MRRRIKTLERALLLPLVLLGAAVCGHAQSAQGYSDVYYDPDYDWVAAIAVTWPDYSTQYYYDPIVSLTLSGTDGFYDSFFCTIPSQCDNGDYAWAGLSATPTPGASYTVHAYHSVEIYYYYYEVDPGCTWGCNDFYDAFGYSFDECSPQCEADPTCYCVDVWGSPSSWYWYAPAIAVLVYMGQQDLGESTDELESPVPVLEVRDGGALISPGQTVNITAGTGSSAPQMAPLTARLVGPSLIGNTTWRIRVQYSGHGRSDSDYFPVGSSRVLSSASSWDVRSDFAGNVRGGSATITYRYSNHPERSFSFQVRGTNPTEADAKSRLGSSPWFLTRLVRQESGIRQFSGSDPLFGDPNGWGMMQLDPPPGPQEIWSWWGNVDVGKTVVNQKDAELTPRWDSRVEEWETWNQQHPAQQVGPPAPRQEGGCYLQWVSGGSGSEGNPSFRDACWIKRYNGLGVPPARDFLVWRNTPPYDQDPRWEVNPSATLPDGTIAYYVRAVCNRAP